MSTQTDFDAYVDGGGKDPAVIRAYAKALALEAAAAVKPAADAPGFNVENTKPAAELNMTTKEFLDKQESLMWRRRNQIEVDAILAAPKFDSEAFEAERVKAQGRALIGNPGGSTNLDGSRR